MKRTPHNPPRRRRLRTGAWAQWRTALGLLLILASALQGVVAQGHVHGEFAKSSGYSALVLEAPTGAADEGGAGQRSHGDSSTACALCQALAAGSAPLVTHAFVLPAPAVSIAIAAQVRVPVVGVSAVSYSWQSRGPPLV